MSGGGRTLARAALRRGPADQRADVFVDSSEFRVPSPARVLSSAGLPDGRGPRSGGDAGGGSGQPRAGLMDGRALADVHSWTLHSGLQHCSDLKAVCVQITQRSEQSARRQ